MIESASPILFARDAIARIYIGHWFDYEADFKRYYGKSADVPQRIKYRTLKR